jgi:hypothetical protein
VLPKIAYISMQRLKDSKIGSQPFGSMDDASSLCISCQLLWSVATTDIIMVLSALSSADIFYVLCLFA